MGASRGDRFEQARGLVLVLWGVAALLLVLGAGASVLRSRHGGDPRPDLVRVLGLTEPVVIPAGRPPRAPAPPAIDLRFDPRLPRAAPDQRGPRP